MSGRLCVASLCSLAVLVGHAQVLIFSQMSKMLNLLEDYCHYRKWRVPAMSAAVLSPSFCC